MSSTSQWSWAILLAVTVGMIFVYGSIDHTVAPYDHWDLGNYLKMAKAAPAIDTQVAAPYRYRPLGPFLVGILPVAETTAFRVLSLLVALALPLCLRAFLLSRGVSDVAATAASLFFVCNRFLFGFNVWDYFQINDLICQILLVFLFWSMLDGRWFRFAVLLLVGSVTREAAMLMIPVAALYLWQNGSSKVQFRAWLFSSLGAVLVFAALRLLMPAHEQGLVEAFGEFAPKFLKPKTWMELLVNSVLPFSFLPILFWKRTREFFGQRLYALAFCVLTFGSTLFGLNNERLMGPVFLVFFWLIGVILDGTGLAKRKAILGFFVVAALIGSLHNYITAFEFLSRRGMLLLSLVALAMATGTGLWGRLQRNDS